MDAINNLFNSLNELIKGDINVRTTNLSNELLETLKLIENCTSCKKYNIKYIKYIDGFHKLINKIESEKEEQKKKETINKLNDVLIDIDKELNISVLCEGCKEKKIKKLIDKCGNEEMAKFLYQCKLNTYNTHYIRWIPFNEFGNIEYLAKGGFGEVSKAKWIGNYNRYNEYKERDVVLKSIYNSGDNILDILKEVNKKFNIDIDLSPP
jgi:hypothetical protein